MSMHFRDLADQAAVNGTISPDEILALRQAGWHDGRIGPDEAEAIFIVNDRLIEASPQWSDFFVEALGEFIVNGIEPKGYVSEEQADWLMARIDHNGRLDSLTELDLLVRLFERAESVPQRLRDYALEQIERAVLTGEGPTRCGGSLETGNVTEAEARLMRRIVFASASERPAAVSRREAELLYKIKDAALGAENAPEWQRLFVQGVGNYLMGFSSHEPLTAARAAELEAFMNDASVSLTGFFSDMARNAIRGNALGSFRSEPESPGLEQRVGQAEELTTPERMWLEGQIDGNGQLDEYDRALLDFLAQEEEGVLTR